MKKAISVLLVLGLIFLVGCENRLPKEEDSSKNAEISKVDSSVEESGSSEPEPTSVEDPEDESKAISIVVDTLTKARVCSEIYQGKLKIDTKMEPQELDGVSFFYVDSQFYSPTDMERYWNNTFVSESRGSSMYQNVAKLGLYVSMNGELYMQESADAPPLTKGEWSTQNIRIASADDTAIVATMNTILEGEPNGEQELKLEKHGDEWLLGDSYFLD